MRDLAGQDFLKRFERIFGSVITAELKDVMHYTYFGTDDIASIIQTRPELFERAMTDIFGKACPAILSMTTTIKPEDISGESEMNVGKSRHKELST